MALSSSVIDMLKLIFFSYFPRGLGYSLPPTISLHLEQLRKVSLLRLFRVLEGFLTSPWVFNLHSWFSVPLRFDERKDLRMGDVDLNGERIRSLEHLLRTLEKGVHLFFVSI